MEFSCWMQNPSFSFSTPTSFFTTAVAFTTLRKTMSPFRSPCLRNSISSNGVISSPRRRSDGRCPFRCRQSAGARPRLDPYHSGQRPKQPPARSLSARHTRPSDSQHHPCAAGTGSAETGNSCLERHESENEGQVARPPCPRLHLR